MISGIPECFAAESEWLERAFSKPCHHVPEHVQDFVQISPKYFTPSAVSEHRTEIDIRISMLT
jgi:hypothetical protein